MTTPPAATPSEPLCNNIASHERSMSEPASPDLPSPRIPSTPDSPHARPRLASSPTERSFFDSIAERIRGRSSSRSRNEIVARDRSRSPLPPTSLDHPSAPSNSRRTDLRRSQIPPRSVSFSDDEKAMRVSSSSPSTPSSIRSSTFTPYGRHSNEWLFGNFSFLDTIKNVIGNRRSSA